MSGASVLRDHALSSTRRQGTFSVFREWGRLAAFLATASVFHESLAAADPPPTVLVREEFEDGNFGRRGWYDGTGPVLSTVEHLPSSTRSAEFRWQVGGTKPVGFGALRRKFTPSESVYVSYWVKYSPGYTGSNRSYHPHEFQLLTTENGDYVGPAFTHLTGYIEQNEGRPVLALQDGQNIDQTRVGQDLSSITENRAVAGCNGLGSDGPTSVDCYRSGADYWNGKIWKAGAVHFGDNPGPYDKADWHRVEAFFKLNRIASGKGVPDGQLRYWFDGVLIIERTNVLMRTAAHPGMQWNQFMIAPYIGDGSPVEQTMWVDDLLLATGRPLADADSDADGMPDAWESAHDLSIEDPADAAQDPDGDGFTNLEEYLAGTDPHDASSSLRILSVELRQGKPVIRFQAAAQKTYRLQRTTDLETRSWSDVATWVSGAVGLVEVEDPGDASAPIRFYRLRL